MTHLAIIGAGMAGLAAAQALASQNITTTIYEKSRGLGGRTSSRSINDCVLDHGPQYIKTPSPALQQLVAATKDSDGATAYDIAQPVWTFDTVGHIGEGDPDQNAEPKWTWPGGVNALADTLAADLDVRTNVEIQRVAATDSASGYTLFDSANNIVGTADGVLLAAPGPQTAAILAASELDARVQTDLRIELSRATYRRILSVTLAYPRRPDVPWYALVNTDRGHPISWLGCEHLKPGHAPEGVGLLIAQMAHDFAVAHWDHIEKGTYGEHGAALPDVVARVDRLVQGLMRLDLGTPLWANVQRWRYALPDDAANFEYLNGTGSGLFFAGDYIAGKGRLHLAIESGWQVAEMIGKHYV